MTYRKHKINESREYNSDNLLFEILACTGLRLGEVPIVTVENVKSRNIEFHGEDGVRYSVIPECLQEVILQFAEDEGIQNGKIFPI